MTQRRLDDDDKAAWLQLARTPNVGPVTFAELLKRYKSPAAALAALPELGRRAGRKRPLKAPALSDIQKEIERTRAYGGEIVCSIEPEYPPHLLALAPPPPVLSMLGRHELCGRNAIAIVGARNASAAGRKIARDMAGELGKQGFVVVSGLARGIDGEAHAAAIQTGTIAVLGGGVDHVYPPQHDRLYAEIAANGLIISESPFGHVATAKDFPRRNRLITGLALGVVVVEAAERSGSLISARTAAEQNRDVMAVPGSPLDPRAAGTNKLIRDGAALVRSAADVMEIVSPIGGGVRAKAPPPFEDDPYLAAPPPDQVAAVLEALAHHPTPIDEIARAAGVGAARCAAILVELELGGQALTFPGGLASLAV